MKRLITLCIAVTVAALIAAPAFAEVQNVKVSGDITTNAVYREDYSLLDHGQQSANSSGSDEHDNRTITNARVRIDADLTDNVSAVVRMLSEWEWDTEANNASGGKDIEFDLANITLKEVFYQPLTVIVGRQNLRYGNAFILGDPDTNTTAGDANIGFGDLSLRKSFDSVRAILDYNPLTVDIFWAKIDETGTAKDDQDLYGVNAAYQFDDYDGEAEAYWMLSRNDSETAPASTGTLALLMNEGHEIHVVGVRGSMTPVENLNIEGEFAWQVGDYDAHSSATRDMDASAFQIGADYAIQGLDWEPTIRASFTHYSGEEIGNSGDMSAWQPLYEDQSHGIVANYLFGGVNGGQNSNADIINVGVDTTPLEDLTLSADVYWFYLDKKFVTSDNSLVSGSSSLSWTNLTQGSIYGKTSDELGYEVDLALNYDYTEDVRMGLSWGWFSPGEALEGNTGTLTNDQTATQVMATLGVAF